MTLDDRITCIMSHAMSLRRAGAGGHMDDLKTLFQAIERIAKEGAEIYTVDEELPNGNPPERVSGTEESSSAVREAKDKGSEVGSGHNEPPQTT